MRSVFEQEVGSVYEMRIKRSVFEKEVGSICEMRIREAYLNLQYVSIP